ncbi:acyltransferase family protein [Moritella sp. Urea-trap-13]|uniref:acyltransferase family protein n=1 Tax=Moritella sp. Urea-trap-13 TaxID=2058327 RepID=UPI000C337B01|nr:acyltransferase family protein [Moritella sp. Urea-trap-13]PKH09390.1 acyltransferase [Moritella sp. Urea-trap-13]
MKFRTDLNGLRAIALIAVVLFHFNPSIAPGGFAGVDIFFVISGFLMTGIIFKGLNTDSLNLVEFYLCRANRIIPPLALLCFTLLLFGWFLLPPMDYVNLGKHAASSITFLSNITYFYESGYFDAGAYEKWLLHTWSLSVEWQFYIIYPIILLFLKRSFSLETLKRLLIVSTVLGFIFCIIATDMWPTFAYFSLPTRAWEMLLGGVAYFYPLKLNENQKRVLEVIGITLMLLSFTLTSKVTPWPGYIACVPVFGTYLILLSNRETSLLTNNRIFQTLGKWSYSIYLWHWPIAVYGTYFNLDNWIPIGLVLSVVFGAMSFYLIESNQFKQRKNTLIFTLMSVLVFVGFYKSIPFMLNHVSGMPKYIIEANLNQSDKGELFTWQMMDQLKKHKFDNTKLNVMFIGDSQSADFVNVINEKVSVIDNDRINFMAQKISAKCGVFYHLPEPLNALYDRINLSKNIGEKRLLKCAARIRKITADTRLLNADFIFIAMNWRNWSLNYNIQAVKAIKQKNPKAKIYIIGNKGMARALPIMMLNAFDNQQEVSELVFESLPAVNIKNNTFFREHQNADYQFINMTYAFCPVKKCNVVDKNGLPFFYDEVHTTKQGAMYLSDRLRPLLPAQLY